MGIHVQTFEFWFDEDVAKIDKVGLGLAILSLKLISCFYTDILVGRTF